MMELLTLAVTHAVFYHNGTGYFIYHGTPP